MNGRQRFRQFPYELVDLILEKFLFEQVVCTYDVHIVMDVLSYFTFLTEIVSSKVAVAIFLKEGTPFSTVRRQVLQYSHFTNSIFLICVRLRKCYIYDLQGQTEVPGMKIRDFMKRRRNQCLLNKKKPMRLMLSTTYDCHLIHYPPRATEIYDSGISNCLYFRGDWSSFGFFDIVWPKYYTQALTVFTSGGDWRGSSSYSAYRRDDGDIVGPYDFSRIRISPGEKIDKVKVTHSKWHLVKKKSWTQRILYAVKRRTGRNSSINSRDRKITEIGHILSLLRAQLNIK